MWVWGSAWQPFRASVMDIGAHSSLKVTSNLLVCLFIYLLLIRSCGLAVAVPSQSCIMMMLITSTVCLVEPRNFYL